MIRLIQRFIGNIPQKNKRKEMCQLAKKIIGVLYNFWTGKAMKSRGGVPGPGGQAEIKKQK